jgi:hypothetical protein
MYVYNTFHSYQLTDYRLRRWSRWKWLTFIQIMSQSVRMYICGMWWWWWHAIAKQRKEIDHVHNNDNNRNSQTSVVWRVIKELLSCINKHCLIGIRKYKFAEAIFIHSKHIAANEEREKKKWKSHESTRVYTAINSTHTSILTKASEKKKCMPIMTHLQSSTPYG